MSAALRRLPPLASTGVGSLPFARCGPAVDHVSRAYELPFCPQLPRLEGDMVTEWLGADPGRCGWSPDRDRQLPAAWDAFVLALAADPPEHGLVKLQVTGPVTLAVALERGAGRPGHGPAVAALAGQISLWLAATATAQAGWLRDELGLDVLLIADEPGLALARLGPEGVPVWDPLRGAAAAWGLHVCCAVPWPLIAASDPDALSFDLAVGPSGPAAAAALSSIVARGGRIVWGVADAGVLPDPGRALAAVERAWARLGRPPGELGAASLLSPSCGTGGHSVAAERSVAHTIARIAALGRGEPVPAPAPVPAGPSPMAAPAGVVAQDES